MKLLKKIKNQWPAYFYILPAFVLYFIFVLFSIFRVISNSFFTWTGITNRYFSGLSNYITLFKDRIFWVAIGNNLIWVVLTLTIPLFLGLLLATILAEIKQRAVLGAIYFVPRTIPIVVAGIIWGWIYNPVFGLLNWGLQKIGLQSLMQPWLANQSTALYALNIVGAWTYFGFCTLIFTTALQYVDNSMYEAASIDGASRLQKFWYITIPSVRNTILFLGTFSMIEAMRFFDLIYVTTKGGPGFSTEVLSTYVYKLFFLQGNYGYASTISLVLILILIPIAISIIGRQAQNG